MAIAIASKSEKKEATFTTSTIIPAPANIEDGDLLIIVLGTDGTNPQGDFVLPTGFALIYDFSGNNTHMSCWKIAASESGSYTVSWTSGTEEAMAFMYRVTGAHASAPIYDPNETDTEVATTSTFTPVASTSEDNSLVFVMHTTNDNTIQPDTGGDADYTLTDADHNGGGSGGVGIAIQTKAIETAAVPPACSYTASGGAFFEHSWFAILEGAAPASGINYRSMSQSIAHSITRPIST